MSRLRCGYWLVWCGEVLDMEQSSRRACIQNSRSALTPTRRTGAVGTGVALDSGGDTQASRWRRAHQREEAQSLALPSPRR